MQSPTNIIIRHRKENLKKCSLRGLEQREDLQFFTHPSPKLPPLSGYLLLALDAPPLTKEDKHLNLLLLDATWRYAETMETQLSPHLASLPRRSLPPHFHTAYPRKQPDCPDPDQGLASVEALFLAYHLLGWDCTGLLDHYHWKEEFLKKNHFRDKPIE